LQLPGTLRLAAGKLLVAALTIVGAVTGVFLLMQFVPGDLATVVLGTRATPELRAAFAEQMGLDQPVPVQLWMFLKAMAQGDFGTDVISGRSILDLIFEVLPFTLALAFSSLALGLVVGISLGVLAASRPGSLVDRGLGFVSIAFVTLPSFVISIVLLLVFSLSLNWLPVSGAGEPGDLADQLLHLILPTIALALGWIGYVARIMRASLLEVLSEPHIRTMRAYGVSERRIIWRYAMRPALIPLVAILGIGLGDLISAAIFAEIIFSRPGLGNLIYKAASMRNYPIVQAGTVVVVLFYILANTSSDLLASTLDPRIKANRAAAP
jgi:peptide/nickel transport system permease protein